MGISRSFIRNRTIATAIRKEQAGVALLEALIAILIFSIGILAVVGMQVTAINNVNDSKYRSEAAFLANRLLSQMWTDAGSIGSYAYPGSGSVPAKLTSWITDTTYGVNSRLPHAADCPPIVAVPNPTAQGAQVTIQVFWQNPEEYSKNPCGQPGAQPHTYTVVATIFTS
jgi:type IV pilus assembly protein PilV